MGANGQASSATEIRHLRESTLERVRLFVNHLGSGLSLAMRFVMDMQRQFWTKDMQVRVLGNDGLVAYPIIQKTDLEGLYDYKAMVLPSIAGQNDVDKKQGMDLFQLLINLPFIDPQKLVTKILAYFDWDFTSVQKAPDPSGGQQSGQPGATGQPPGAA